MHDDWNIQWKILNKTVILKLLRFLHTCDKIFLPQEVDHLKVP